LETSWVAPAGRRRAEGGGGEGTALALDGAHGTHGAADDSEPGRRAPLSAGHSGATSDPREKQVLDLLATGRTAKEVAFELGNSHATVRVLYSRAMAKLRAARRTGGVTIRSHASGRALPAAIACVIASVGACGLDNRSLRVAPADGGPPDTADRAPTVADATGDARDESDASDAGDGSDASDASDAADDAPDGAATLPWRELNVTVPRGRTFTT